MYDSSACARVASEYDTAADMAHGYGVLCAFSRRLDSTLLLHGWWMTARGVLMKKIVEAQLMTHPDTVVYV